MIEIIRNAIIEESLSVYEIHMSEDDDILQHEIDSIINSNVLNYNYLFNKLSFLIEHSSIDIQRIKIRGRNREKQPVDFFIQSNGLIGINKIVYSEFQTKISSLVERCLFA